MSQIVLFGGSFNPPHWGHWQVCDYLRGLSRFDEVWVIPTYDHPFEKNLASFNHREAMCRLMVDNLGENVSICSIEGELKCKPSYMIDTLRALKKKYPSYGFTIAVGSDCKDQLPKWKDIEALKKESAFYFFPRPGHAQSPFMDISSTQIRALIRERKPYTKYLVPAVADYIEGNKLYL